MQRRKSQRPGAKNLFSKEGVIINPLESLISLTLSLLLNPFALGKEFS